MLGALPPAERVAFVLHDLFDVPFEEVAPVVGRTVPAARQLASRGRRRVRSVSGPIQVDPARYREVVVAFRAASRGGDVAALVRLLDPEVVLRADAAAVAMGAPESPRGAEAVVGTFVGRARAARVVLFDGVAGLAWIPEGAVRSLFHFETRGGRIVAIALVADPGAIARANPRVSGA